MAQITTNRDLHAFLQNMVTEGDEGTLSLQAYLENLRELGRQRRTRAALTPSEFADLLQAAFTPTMPAGEPHGQPAAGFTSWEARITRQIVDLKEMNEAGTLNNEYRHFGVDAPSGTRWYNFDPYSFLECAAEGAFGGWRDGDDTGREYVPGPVAVLSPSGSVTAIDARELVSPVVELSGVSWELFEDFVHMGQIYE